MKLSYFGFLLSYNLLTVWKYLLLLGRILPNGQTANYLQAGFVSVFHLENRIKISIFHFTCFVILTLLHVR